MARIRRDAMLPEIHALFARARAEPTLAKVVAAARREELARAGAIGAGLFGQGNRIRNL